MVIWSAHIGENPAPDKFDEGAEIMAESSIP